MIKVGSDFSGVGAFNQSLIRLGVNYKEVFACDMDKFARQTFIHNYGEPEYYPTNVYDRQIPEEPLDIYMTSPPCQAFSFAGKRLGKEDKRGILFFNSHEFIKVNNPRFFIFENVKGLLSDDNGNTFNEWVNMLGGKSVNGEPVLFPYDDSVPYHLYWKVLNAKHHGVPQNRERVFLIGIRDDKDNTFRWPIEEYLSKRLKDVLEDDVDEKYYLSEKMLELLTYEKKGNCEIANINKGGQRGSVADENGDYIGCLTAVDYKLPKLIQVKSATSKGYEEASEGDSINFSVPSSETRPVRVGKVVPQNLDTSCNQGVMIYKEFRTEEAKKIRKETGTNNFRDKECGFFEQDYANTLTNVQKDNVILLKQNENKFRFYKDDYKKSGIQGMDIIKPNGIADTITNNHPGNVMINNNKRLNETIEKHGLLDGEITLIDSYNKSVYKDTSHTISTRVNASNCTHLWDGYKIRRLTPRECFRLMDFPDSFSWPVSDSQAYKQAGNSIVVNVLYKILKNLPL